MVTSQTGATVKKKIFLIIDYMLYKKNILNGLNTENSMLIL